MESGYLIDIELGYWQLYGHAKISVVTPEIVKSWAAVCF